jgi:hypothetical protein
MEGIELNYHAVTLKAAIACLGIGERGKGIGQLISISVGYL